MFNFYHAYLAIQHPNATLRYFLRRIITPPLLGYQQRVRTYLSELHTKKEFLNSLDRKLRSVGFETRVIKTRQAELYAIVRLLKPNIIVETGVENGISASFILQALKDNNYGKLYSIEITQILANGREAGWIIPSDLKSRWELLIGNSLEVLPILCRS